MYHKEMNTRGDDGLSWVRTLPGSQRLRALIMQWKNVSRIG